MPEQEKMWWLPLIRSVKPRLAGRPRGSPQSREQGNEERLRFSVQIVGYRALHEGTVPILAVDAGKAGMEILFGRKGPQARP
jgi:hypothetical protein